MNFFVDEYGITGFGVLCAVLLAIFCIYATIGTLMFINTLSHEDVWLDGKLIYSGSSRFVCHSQLGENGNRYYVSEYQHNFCGFLFNRQINYWVGEKLIVNNKKGEL